MSTRRAPQPLKAPTPTTGQTTFGPGDYGRLVQADGTERWWVRSANGTWTVLSHQRVVENEDGTLTLLYVS